MEPDPVKHVDADIDAALAQGDRRRALTLLMDRYGSAIYRFAYEMTRDGALADEVRQQTFVEAYRDLSTFQRRSSLRTWLFGIARHRCLDATKMRNRWMRRFKNEAEEEPAYELPTADLDRSRIAAALERCIGKLAPAAREAVMLRYQQDLSYDEAASVTGDRPGTLQQRVGRALPVLKKCVENQLAAPVSAPAATVPTARIAAAEGRKR
jgi:RNA polymerase sigma-70 factor (ECF subfamily)